MNTHKPAHKAKARHLCFLILLCLHLAWAGVPGPCRHSVTKDHLLNLNRLIDNQLENGCSITYSFTERQSLGKVCYVKAAFPQILELLNTHFQYGKRSDNRRYVNALKKVIYNLYSQRCIPEINEEIEYNPVKFVRVHNTSPKRALQKAKGVIQMYMTLMTESSGPVDWNCEEEYAEDYPESTTTFPTATTGGPECQCSCPTFGQTAPDVTLLTPSIWGSWPKSILSQPTSAMPTRPPNPTQGTTSIDTWVSPGNPDTGRFPSPKDVEGTLSDGRSIEGDREGKDSPPPTRIKTDSALYKSELDVPSATDVPHLSTQSNIMVGTHNSLDETLFSYTETEGAKEVFTYSSLGRGVAGSPQDQFVPVSEVKMLTPVPFLYGLIGLTPSSDESTVFVLAKRSLDAGLYGVQHDSWPYVSPHQDGISTPGLQTEDTRERHTGPGSYQIESPTTKVVSSLEMTEQDSMESKIPSGDLQTSTEDLLSPVTEPEPNHLGRVYKEVISTNIQSQGLGKDTDRTYLPKEPNGDLRKEFQNGKTGHSGWSISYQIVLIIGAVCGGLLLLITTLCCLRPKRGWRHLPVNDPQPPYPPKQVEDM